MYLQKIQKLKEKIAGSKNIEIHSFSISPPLKEESLKMIAEKYNLKSSLLSFFEEVNGFQLSYTYKSNKDFDRNEFGFYDDSFPLMWPNENYWQLDGCINILPLDFIVKNNWKDYIWFENEVNNTITYKGIKLDRLEFEKKIKPLDIFSKNSIAAFYFDGNLFNILLSTDHNSSFTDYEPLDFEDYFDGLIETNGLINERKKIFTG